MGLSETAIKILEKEEVEGQDFFDLTEERLRSVGLGLGPAMRLVKFAKECKDKKLRSFSSYKTKKELGEVLRKYGIDSSEISKIPPFEPEPVEIDDEDEELEQCIKEIKRRMGIIGSATGRNDIFPQYYMHPSILPKESLRKELPWTPSSKL